MRQHVRAVVICILSFCATAFSEELQSTTNEKWNFKVSYSPKWEPTESKSDLVIMSLQRGPNEAILLSAHESDETLGMLVKTYEIESKVRPDVKEIERAETTIGGERAVVIKTTSARGNAKFTMYIAIFGHQGIAYRIVGVSVRDDEGFQGELHDFFNNFTFLKPREEWLKRYEGAPAASALLGGLVVFELNRPRWKEETFSDERDYAFDEQASFGFVTGGAWVNVRVKQVSAGAGAGDESEVGEMQDHLQGLYKNAKPLPAPPLKNVPGAKTFAFTGDHEGDARLIHGVVLAQDGIVVRLWMETLKTQSEIMRKDWDKLVASLKIQKPAGLVPAYSSRPNNRRRHKNANPAVARILAVGTAVLKAPKSQQLRAISPDGTRALLQTPAGLLVEDLSTHKSEQLATTREYGEHAAFSPDGSSVACALDAGITIYAKGAEPQTLEIGCEDLAFAPGGGDLLLCVPTVPRENPVSFEPFSSNRLELVKAGDAEKRKTLLQFPLSKFSLPVYSPDGKSLALACNRDCVRSDKQAKHVYVCSAEGGELKQLTREPEQILSLAWSPDNQWIYAVRALQDAGQPTQYAVTVGDLFRISVATGQSENLTKCGMISRVWSAGDDVLLQIGDWTLDEEQTGIFRFKVKDLGAATAGQPETIPASAEARIARVAEGIIKTAGKKILKDKLTLELIQRCARAFAENASREFQINLDFSRASLDNLATILPQNNGLRPEIRTYMLGFGAYYGETLCKDGAEWDIRPEPFNEWLPSNSIEGNNLVDVVLPFSESWNVMMHSEYTYLRRSEGMETREQGQKILLVYPSSHAAEALKKATGPNYLEAIRRVDAGDVEGGLQLMTQELQMRPRNRQLATSVISLCKAAGMPELATKLTKDAVDGGNEVPELLISYADSVAAADQNKAIELYRKAAGVQWGSSDAYVKLGKVYDAAKQPAIAESCWRQAYWQAPRDSKKEILKLMKIEAEPDADDNLDLDN